MAHLAPRQLTAFEQLDERARLEVLEHVAGCADCRRRLLADDPTRGFALLALQPIPESALDRLSARISARLDEEDEQRGPARRAALRWTAVAGVAASLMLAALVGVTSLRLGTAPDRRAAVDTAAMPVTETADLQRLLDAITPVEGVEILSSRGGDAEVFEMAVGEDTQLVMIFDEALEL